MQKVEAGKLTSDACLCYMFVTRQGILLSFVAEQVANGPLSDWYDVKSEYCLDSYP